MDIVQVATGLISVPPNGWGAVERIIWMYQDRLNHLGVNCSIQNWNEVEKKHNQLVHCHMANTALDMRDRGIPYVYSLHDHHAEWYGKDSVVYANNLAAIKGSVFSICHSKHIIDYFDGTDKLFFLPHGVDTNFFTFRDEPKEHSLLMIANNGIAGDSTIDRKGFRYAIEAAKALDLPITIAGPPNNHSFFDGHPDLIMYDKLRLRCHNPTDQETLELYHSHSIFMAPSFLEYGHPNLSLLEAASCGLPIVGTCNNPVSGMLVCETNTESVLKNLKIVIHNHDRLREMQLEKRKQYDWFFICKQLKKMYGAASVVRKNWTSEDTTKEYLLAYV